MGLQSKREPGYRYLTPEEAQLIEDMGGSVEYMKHDLEQWAVKRTGLEYFDAIEMRDEYPGHYHTSDYWRIKVCDTES